MIDSRCALLVSFFSPSQFSPPPTTLPPATTSIRTLRRIWEFAEGGYKETKSSALLASELRAAGFQKPPLHYRDNPIASAGQ
jgi:hypothetical protein